MHLLAAFFAGAFLCNALPHLISGLQGAPFPSPFATPPGIGDSSPPVNVLWGSANLFAGLLLLALHPVAVGLHADFAVLTAGFLAIGVFGSLHFGKVRRHK